MAYNYTNPFASSAVAGGNFGSPYYQNTPQFITGDLIFVLDENAARSYPVANGQKVTLWDKDNPRFYIKSVDMNGIPSFRKFTFTEEKEVDVIETPKPVQTVTDEYVTKADFDAFAKKMLDKLNERPNYKKPQQNKENN